MNSVMSTKKGGTPAYPSLGYALAVAKGFTRVYAREHKGRDSSDREIIARGYLVASRREVARILRERRVSEGRIESFLDGLDGKDTHLYALDGNYPCNLLLVR